MKPRLFIFVTFFAILLSNLIPLQDVHSANLLYQQQEQNPHATPTPTSTSTPAIKQTLSQDERKSKEAKLTERIKNDNGIIVGEPKIYDDSQLQRMLENARLRLGGINLIDQASIAKNLGALSGASQTISSFDLQIKGPSIPGSEISSTGTTSSLDNVVTRDTTADGKLTKKRVITRKSTDPTESVVTTIPQLDPPESTPPEPTTELPKMGFSVSSSDILNEQLQLTYEITNLSLLLEGSLSDRVYRSLRQVVKPRATIGFPITISPDRRHKDAVAIVEVEVIKEADLNAPNDSEPPALTAILPREKTYNVAAITDRSASVGAGVATQILGISGSFLRGRKTYYLVKDQDTLAMTYQPEETDRVGFSWQFRPVLDQRYVLAGLKQTFVQISFPAAESDPIYGKVVRIRTYWRHYDRKKGVVKDLLAGSLNENTQHIPIYSIPLSIPPATLSTEDLEDIGNGQLLVNLQNRFLPGTSIRIGSQIINLTSPNNAFEQTRIRFVAPIVDLATKEVAIVGRDGTETKVKLALENSLCEKLEPLKIEEVKISTHDQTNSLVKIKVNEKCFVVGRKDSLPVFGITKDFLNTLKTYGVTEEVLTKLKTLQNIKFTEEKTFKEVVEKTSANQLVTQKTVLARAVGTLPPAKPFPLVILVGGRVFGYSDAPILYEGNTLTAVVPTALLMANPSITVKILFADKDYQDTHSIAKNFGASTDNQNDYLFSQTDKLIILEPREKDVKFLLLGNRLKDIKVLEPSNISLTSLNTNENTMTTLILTKEDLKKYKQVLVQRPSERPFLISIPALEVKEEKDPDLKPKERISLMNDEAVIETTNLSNFDNKITFKGNSIPYELDKNRKFIVVKSLVGNKISTIAGKQTLIFHFKNGKEIPVTLEVVSSKVELISPLNNN